MGQEASSRLSGAWRARPQLQPQPRGRCLPHPGLRRPPGPGLASPVALEGPDAAPVPSILLVACCPIHLSPGPQEVCLLLRRDILTRTPSSAHGTQCSRLWAGKGSAGCGARSQHSPRKLSRGPSQGKWDSQRKRRVQERTTPGREHIQAPHGTLGLGQLRHSGHSPPWSQPMARLWGSL